MPEIVVTGASGFVGRNLCPYLEKQGYRVNKLSLRDPAAIEQLPAGAYAVIHLAGLAHDLKNATRPQDYFKVNTELTIRVFDAFQASAAQRFIYFSSVKAAADSPGSRVIDEDFTPVPATAYGQSKLEAEQHILAAPVGDKRVYVVRPCMIHGPGNKGNLNLLYRIVAAGVPYPLAGFDNRRSFLSIDNLNFMVGELCARDVPSGVYNLADSECLSTLEVVEIIKRVTGSRSATWRINKRLVATLARIGSTLRLPLNEEKLHKLTSDYVVSNAKILRAIGRQLPVTAADGIARTIASFHK
jgi:nucleoside-diphosphate-sugar epimerase